jgi:hypothetical protein
MLGEVDIVEDEAAVAASAYGVQTSRNQYEFVTEVTASGQLRSSTVLHGLV